MNSKLCEYDEVKSEGLRKLTISFFSSNVDNVVHYVTVVKLITNLRILGIAVYSSALYELKCLNTGTDINFKRFTRPFSKHSLRLTLQNNDSTY